MKNLFFVISIVITINSCHSPVKVKLNDKETIFTQFPSTDSLTFTKLSNQIIGTPQTILKYGDYLIINTFNNDKSKWIIVYSLKENRIVKKAVNYGKGPDELLSCRVGLIDNQIWLYDMTKKEISKFPVDSLILNDHLNIRKFKINRSYYSVTLISDSVMLGTNDLINPSKISYVNLKDGSIICRSEYAILSENTPLGALIDACSCYINVSPDLKYIALSYRYSDMLEIYKKDGTLIHALHGPYVFNIEFNSASSDGRNFMIKNRKTRKAFVNSYATDYHIYLLFSGHKRNEKEWSMGRDIFTYSWDGKPLRSWHTDTPIYSFCIDEKEQTIYSYSMVTGELIKAKI